MKLWRLYPNSAISNSLWVIRLGEWKLESLEMGYALVCSECGRILGLRKAEMADIDISKCPTCEKDMDLDSIDEDELMEYARGEFK